MAALTGTSSSYSVGTGGGNREDLEDVIHDLFPEDTWALTNLDKLTASATLHEWLGDSPAAAAANIGIEGDDATFATIANPSRYTNYTQIFRKTFLVSGTQEKVNKAGRASEVGRQSIRKLRELKRDIEFSLTRNSPGTVGSATVGRSSAGMEGWLGSGTTGAAVAGTSVLSTTTSSATTVAVTSGTVLAAPTDGTTFGPLTEAALKLALEGAWTNGGDVDTILVSPTNKAVIDGITGVAQRNIDIGRTQQASITGASNFYVSSFGTHKVVQHRYMRDAAALCLDSSLWALAWLRRPFSEPLAKTGDGMKRQIIAEGCLVSRNNLGSAKVVGMAAT